MRDEKRLEIFVPALALEHPSNPEFATRREKLELAVMRYSQNGDFFNPTDKRPAPFVFLDKILFQPSALGYAVSAIVQAERVVEK